MSELAPEVSLPSRIASLVHAHFDALPTKCKPTIFPDGSKEWIPMTGIVAVKGMWSGAKCLSASHIPRCRGLVLHDCHAEILSIRAFNYWLLTECHGLMAEEQLENTKPSPSPFIRRRELQYDCNDSSTASIDWPPYEIQPDVKLYMYCTCAPCGDGSMELCMAAQEDATPWEVVRETHHTSGAQEGPATMENSLLDGRAHFSLLGVVRRKPARTDAESTRSKSCSDKLALKQVSSLISWQTSQLVAPTQNAYLAGLVLPEDEISQIACDRAFGENGRMKALRGRSWPSGTPGRIGYQFHPFQILSVPAEEVQALWTFAKPKSIIAESTDTVVTPKKSKPGNVSAVWTLAPSHSHTCAALSDTGSKQLPSLFKSRTGLYESIIGGVKQGNKPSSPIPRGASALSRAKLWALASDAIKRGEQQMSTTAEALPETSLQENSNTHTYKNMKEARNKVSCPLHIREEAIRDARESLKGWIRNLGDESWGLDVLVDPKKRKR
ncbi:hypothetical protein N7520_011576 [Penicillium odoratum]|uniref:uncharacterized protein n=1 Tax=Penicillium odoratum TaxID=1167516 RepID=UPI0025475F15|nr:uncharacterized protein N7520_011576 [Penicillium odoratum]KAJ5746394.1 hypothetical protein N7520_011576 [Penicillium odoratum]